MFPSTPANPDARQLLAALSDPKPQEKVRRIDSHGSQPRAALSVGVLVVPLSDDSPDIARAFTALTKDVSATGIGVVANRSVPTSEALLRLSAGSGTRMLRTTICNRKELGEGWVQFDMEVTGVVDKSEYPQLKQFVGSILP